MKLVMMNASAASFGERSGNCAMYCWICPIWFGSRLRAWMNATSPVGMAAKMTAGKATAPSRTRFERRSRHSLPKTAPTYPMRTGQAASLPSISPTIWR